MNVVLSPLAGYGRVAACFLMISEVTGDSKGYGLVKYLSSEAAAQARHLLNGKEVGQLLHATQGQCCEAGVALFGWSRSREKRGGSSWSTSSDLRQYLKKRNLKQKI